MSINTIIDWQQIDQQQQQELLKRPTLATAEDTRRDVAQILDKVKAQGDAALQEFTARFDRLTLTTMKVTPQEITEASARIGPALKQAMQVAKANIEAFHLAQRAASVDIEAMPGIRCQQVIRPIHAAGLYIPGGSAPLFSTVMMLATPAAIAGCREVVLCSPPPIADEILYAAALCGITQIYQVGGAQAIAAMSFGTETVPKVDKIFGPGNAWVTEAKRQVSQRQDGAAIDMPAGPSELLVIADAGANPDFIAADLLSQAEHGPDSQVILLTPDRYLAEKVTTALAQQLVSLPRAETAAQALSASRIIIARHLAQCIGISNRYGPEHLIFTNPLAS